MLDETESLIARPFDGAQGPKFLLRGRKDLLRGRKDLLRGRKWASQKDYEN
tara:strand:+ start:167 stop:319 length:153 start_codon:yes stop_codon:yes gene_type:complete